MASEAELQNRFSVRPRDFRFRHKLNSTCQFWEEELSHRNIDVHNVMDSINDTLSQIEEQLVRIKSFVSINVKLSSENFDFQHHLTFPWAPEPLPNLD